MGRFINFIINFLINAVIIITLLGLCLIGFVFLLSKSNNTSFEDTISYVKSFTDEVSHITLTDKELIDINIKDNNIDNNIDNNVNDIKTNSTNNKFYYKQLDDTSKIIYDELENNINNLKKDKYKINFSTKFNKLLNKSDGKHKLNRAFQTALDAFSYDHPELFYIDITKHSLIIEYISLGSQTTYTVHIEPKDNINYLQDSFNNELKVNDAVNKVEKIRNNLINSLTDSNDYNKAKTVHDALVNSLDYDTTTKRTNTHNIYGALYEKKVVCEGYAKAFKYILDSLNIECILVSGTGTNSSGETEPHMWNLIKLDGNWYGVDVTWDDPIIIGGKNNNIIRHDYFCKGSNVFSKSHIVNTKISDKGSPFTIPTLMNKNYK